MLVYAQNAPVIPGGFVVPGPEALSDPGIFDMIIIRINGIFWKEGRYEKRVLAGKVKAGTGGQRVCEFLPCPGYLCRLLFPFNKIPVLRYVPQLILATVGLDFLAIVYFVGKEERTRKQNLIISFCMLVLLVSDVASLFRIFR